MTISGNTVTPESVEEAEIRECEYNLTDFLPTSEEWLAFIKCLTEDNVEELMVFSKLVNWENFLHSRDISGAFLHCSPRFLSSVSTYDNKHPFPSNPFFVALFYNAKKCLAFMHESGLDFSTISEHGFSAYHCLLGAMRFISTRRFETDTSGIVELIGFFHHTLFTPSQQGRMLRQKSCSGMDPLCWGVYLGLANYVEYIIYYHCPQSVLRTEPVGISEHITLDVSEFVGENPIYFTCPLSALLDLYGESTLPELKRLGIFRKGLFWTHWIDVLYRSNVAFVYSLLLIAMALIIATVTFAGPRLNTYLRQRCAGSESDLPIGTVVLLALWFIYMLVGLLFGTIGVIRKEYIRRKCNYPRWPRKYYWDLLSWFLPNLVSFPFCTFMLWLYVDIERSCNLMGSFIYTVSGLCNIIFLLSCVSQVVCYLRLVPYLTTLMSSFYNSLSAFSMFVVFYLCLTGVFARMFQSSFIFSAGAGNSTSTASRPDTALEFLRAFYITFLVSLNIVDSTVYIPQEDRIDLNVTHLFYILFVPILFINFVVGILSSVVNQVMEHDIENRYIMMLSIVDFSERILFPLRRLFKPRSLIINICEPLRPMSKLIKMHRTSILSSKVSVD